MDQHHSGSPFKLLAHSWELMQNNENRDLGSLDESGLEGCNKILRSIRINLSRKVSQTLNLVDTINRMWVSSDPWVNNERGRLFHSARIVMTWSQYQTLREKEHC